METKSLREVLATNDELRRKAQLAAAQAAYKVVKEAGIAVTPEDVAAAQGDVGVLLGLGTPDKKDKDAAEVLAAGAVLVGVLTGF